jgi:hypothetical protein
VGNIGVPRSTEKEVVNLFLKKEVVETIGKYWKY